MMSFAAVSLGLGLVLLVVAASLLWRASRRDVFGAQADSSVRPGVTSSAQSASDTQDAAPVIAGPTEDSDSASNAAEKSTSPSSSGFGGRRGRRQWAAAHGCEYVREDPFLSAEWPVSLVRELSPGNSGPAAREVVSGFLEGHQLHIAEVSGSTIFALRRGAYSPVNVHISTSAAMPAGMRHDSSLDRGEFTVYTSDPRAVARMLDIRVETALVGLTGKVRDVALSGAWVAARCEGRLDPAHWDSVLPHLLMLDAASRTLPPMVTTAILDLSVADPTRPRPGSGVKIAAPSVAAGIIRASGGFGEGDQGTGEVSRPGYLRAVPDAPAASDGGGGAGAPDAEASEDQADKRPIVERPAVPVDFPTRSQRQVLGEADRDGSWPEDVADDGLTTIPALGEEPSPPPAPTAGDPRIVRQGASATIFSDALGNDDSIGDMPEGEPAVDPEVVDPKDE